MTGVKPTSIKVEMDELDGGSVWVDVSADVRNQMPITAEYGIRSSDITKRVATGGNLSFVLDNSWTNASTIRGWYSPDGASTRGGFAIGTKTRLQIAYGGSTFTKFVGKIDKIDPEPGKRQNQSTRINVVDWMNAAGRFKMRASMPIQVDKKMNQVITSALSAITEQPESTSLTTGQDTFTYALDTGRARQTTMLRALQKLSDSELGYVYVKGNNASGGVLTSESRHTRILIATSSASVNDDMGRMKVGRKRKRIKNAVRVRTHPRTVDTTASQLFTLDYTPEVRSGAQSIVITGEYTDPTNANRPCGGASVIIPLPGTDYTANTQSDGSGTDLSYDQKGRTFEVITASENLLGYWMLAEAASDAAYAKEETDIYRAKYGTASAVVFGATGIRDATNTIGDNRTSVVAVAPSSYIDIYSTDLATGWDGSQGTVSIWARMGVGAWDDGAWRDAIRLSNDAASNILHIGQTTTTEQLMWRMITGGTANSACVTYSAACTTMMHLAATWSESASKFIAYFNGVQAGSAAMAGAWSGSLHPVGCVLGNSSNDGSVQQGWSGALAHAFVTDEVLTAASVKAIYNAASGGVSVDATIGGFATEYNITNLEPTAAFITLLQLRGRRVTNFQPVTQVEEDTTSQTSYGDGELFLDMHAQEDPLVGKDAAGYLLGALKDPITDIGKIEFMANSASELMTAALDIEPGDRVRIQETVSGVDTDFFVNGVKLKIKPPYNIWCTWYVVPATDTLYWSIGTAGFSEIGETTFVVY
ncbi:MAG: hypothetical protein ACXABY_15600 [Candidatus Thorarchaeota archaeon]|jgi:hypothetical protein